MLRSGGQVLFVLEEMIPQWSDLLNPKLLAKSVFNAFFNTTWSRRQLPRLRLLVKSLMHQDWPLQSDHIRILESDIQDWIAQDFEVVRRIWVNQYLTFELRKI